MLALDTSVLLYAVNRHVPEHPRAAQVLQDLVDGDLPWAIPAPVLHEFLHVVSHPHAVARPLRAIDAGALLQQIAGSRSMRVLGPTAQHAGVLMQLVESLDEPRGIPAGLEIAVILKEHGVRELLSVDRHMRRFSFLTVIDPVHGGAWSPTQPPRRRYRRLRA
jgi:predicted nucleic acid-binding protein